MNGLFGRAVLAFLLLPGVVAFLIPWLLLQRTRSLDGFIPFLLGVALLVWCVWAFSSAGQGTLAPWTPPRRLVVTGLYRLSRNPMYIAVVLILSGWALGFHSRVIAIYTLVVMLAFHLRVVLGEEPWLAHTHGEEWVRYKAQVPRWFGFHRGDDSKT